MNCCAECFSSPYLKEIINGNNTISNCEFCLSKSVCTFDAKNLFSNFQPILDLYVVNDEVGTNIELQIEKDYHNNIFSNKLTDSSRKDLIIAILENNYDSYSHLFNNCVIPSYVNNPVTDELINPLQISWTNFSEEIKSTNRFHLKNILDLKKLEILLFNSRRTIRKGEVFYRGRISDEKGFDAKNMRNPPSKNTKSGRANPAGISYLYIADQLETTLYETRASLLDFVSIGTFRLIEDIEVVNLRENLYDPILLAADEGLEDFMIYLPFITKLEQELSKPNRRNDSELDYLPTQYLSEFIKSIGYDGVEYQSSLYAEGYNLAIFNTDKFECINVEVREISKIKFTHNQL